MKNIAYHLGLITTLLLTSTAWGQLEKSIGPHLPMKGAREYLNSVGAHYELIDKIVSLKDLGAELFGKYSQSENVNVRHLIALNPYIPMQLLVEMVRDKDEFVRQGVAKNPALTRELSVILGKDPSYRVQSSLVRNASVSEELIKFIYKNNKKVTLVDFAMNPKCPESIRSDIRKSGNKLANEWLSISQRSAGGAADGH